MKLASFIGPVCLLANSLAIQCFDSITNGGTAVCLSGSFIVMGVVVEEESGRVEIVEAWLLHQVQCIGSTEGIGSAT